ncbi:apolipoprotein L3-like [Acropora muricata]|uniref:apolipoprotein L3-like n=1 Tax=Acropora millepora TaxID=45264 RepID=UPI001CF16552|nr:apolipoprotein L3-like [Acropora millepora]
MTEKVNDHSTLARLDNSDGGSENKDSLVINQITEQFEQLRMLRMDLINDFVRWIPIRQRTMEQLEELATKLHEHHRNVNISTITGASMGTLGGALSIAGLIAAPFTFGAGLIVSLVGAGIGGAGGLVMSGSKVVEIILEKLGLKDVQAAIKEDHDACTKLQQQLDCLEDFISKLAQFLKPLHDDAILLRELEGTGFDFLRERIISDDIGSSTEERVDIGAKFFRTVTAAATITTSAVATAGAVARSAALAGTRAAHVAGSVISAALIPLDITLLVKSSLELHRGSTSSAVEEIRQKINDLKCPDVEEIKGLVESFIDEKFTEAYNKMDDETNEENYIDVDLEDNSDDNNYQIKIEDSEERRETDRERLWPK